MPLLPEGQSIPGQVVRVIVLMIELLRVCVAAVTGIILHRRVLPALIGVDGAVSRLIVAVVPILPFVAIPEKVADVLHLIMSVLMRTGLHTEAVPPVVEVLILEAVLLRVVVLHEVVVPFVPVEAEGEEDNKTFRLDI